MLASRRKMGDMSAMEIDVRFALWRCDFIARQATGTRCESRDSRDFECGIHLFLIAQAALKRLRN